MLNKKTPMKGHVILYQQIRGAVLKALKDFRNTCIFIIRMSKLQLMWQFCSKWYKEHTLVYPTNALCLKTIIVSFSMLSCYFFDGLSVSVSWVIDHSDNPLCGSYISCYLIGWYMPSLLKDEKDITFQIFTENCT